jgi:hypothetical protein
MGLSSLIFQGWIHVSEFVADIRGDESKRENISDKGLLRETKVGRSRDGERGESREKRLRDERR